MNSLLFVVNQCECCIFRFILLFMYMYACILSRSSGSVFHVSFIIKCCYFIHCHSDNVLRALRWDREREYVWWNKSSGLCQERGKCPMSNCPFPVLRLGGKLC